MVKFSPVNNPTSAYIQSSHKCSVLGSCLSMMNDSSYEVLSPKNITVIYYDDDDIAVSPTAGLS